MHQYRIGAKLRPIYSYVAVCLEDVKVKSGGARIQLKLDSVNAKHRPFNVSIDVYTRSLFSS
jgi:hypothetical protein